MEQARRLLAALQDIRDFRFQPGEISAESGRGIAVPFGQLVLVAQAFVQVKCGPIRPFGAVRKIDLRIESDVVVPPESEICRPATVQPGQSAPEIFEKIVSAGAVRDVFGQQVIRSDGQDFRGAEDSGFRQFFQSFGFAYIAFGGRAAFEKVFRARFRTDLSGAGDGARYRVADRCFENGFQVRIHRRNRFLGNPAGNCGHKYTCFEIKIERRSSLDGIFYNFIRLNHSLFINISNGRKLCGCAIWRFFW